MKTDETRNLVEAYFRAWSGGDCDRARTMVADDLKLVTPMNSYDTADAMIPVLKQISGMMKKSTLLRSVVEGDHAVLFHETVFPEPAGTMRSMEIYKVANGKIRSIDMIYDPTGLKLLRTRAA
ncbi:MAG: nuclear transport factor 2 family protein [Myxococcaceae bacterium]